MRTALILGIAFTVALAFRVVPAWHAVFTPTGVNFQDNDSWFEMRSIQNLSAHFPAQSGFDPYAIFPGGQVLYPQPWDLTVASVAKVVGAGKPTPELIDEVGAWLPAIVGALLTIPLYFLGRRLFGNHAASWSVLALATIPGTFLWETHLGVPDHHAAECFLSLSTLALLCAAAECEGRARQIRTIFAGLLLGIYLCVRPAGIFVPGILALAAMLEPELALPAGQAIALSCPVFLMSSGNKWALFTWASLAASLAACLVARLLGGFWRKKQWPGWLRPVATAVGILVAVALVAALQPRTFFAMLANIRRFLPGGQDLAAVNSIRELWPIWRVDPGGVRGIVEMLGGIWILALPGLALIFVSTFRGCRPAVTLFAVWGTVMTLGGILQLRMLVYSAPILALAGGVFTASAIGEYVTDRVRWLRPAIGAAVCLLLLASGVPAGARQIRWDSGPSSGWRAALTWLRTNSPEPMGAPDGWTQFRPRLASGRLAYFAYPASAYSVMTWWDYGDWVNAIGHRPPSTNGTQIHAIPVARFFTATEPADAIASVSELGARYVVVNPDLLGAIWPVVGLWAGRDESGYTRTIFAADGQGDAKHITVYLPGFFRSMAAHLYLFDGRAVTAGVRRSVFITHKVPTPTGGEADLLVSEQTFSSAADASRYMSLNAGQEMILGTTDPTVSCVELEGLPWIRRVFASDSMPFSRDRVATAVKVFEVIR